MATKTAKRKQKKGVQKNAKVVATKQFVYQLNRKQRLLMATFFGLLAMLLYAPSVQYDFVYDDDAVIVKNKFVQQGFAGLDDIWTTTYFKGYRERINARAYRPVPLTALALEYQAFGLNAQVHHATNILFYGLTGFFIFLFLAMLLREHHIILPIMVALFFVVHPLHIEVVANIKSRDELLAFLNYIIAFWLLLKYVDSKKVLTFAAAIFFFSIALFSKESAITTLAVIPLGLYFFRDLKWQQIAKYTAPFFGATIIFLIIRSAIVGGLNAGVTLTPLDNSLLAADGFAQRSASNILVLGYYWFKTFLPHPLLSDYSYVTIPLVNWDEWKVYLSLLTYIGLTIAAVRGFFKKQPYAYAILYYFATISLFTSLVVTNVSAYNDRFQYNAVLGVCLLMGLTIYLLVKPKREGEKWQLSIADFMKKNVLPLGLVAVLAGLAIFKIVDHLPVWENRDTLFAHDIVYSPNNARMHKNYGGAIARQALAAKDATEKTRLANEAIKELEHALGLYNRIPTGHVHLGNMYFILRDYDQAEQSFRTALTMDSNNHYAQANLANIIYRRGEYAQVVQMLEGLNKRNFSKNDYYLLSLAYEKQGNNKQAEYYRKYSGR
ncbi:MAG: tetratricopeptide repeat protein [Saprospiraceae bacterium]